MPDVLLRGFRLFGCDLRGVSPPCRHGMRVHDDLAVEKATGGTARSDMPVVESPALRGWRERRRRGDRCTEAVNRWLGFHDNG